MSTSKPSTKYKSKIKRKNWHRGLDMALKPLFQRKGFDSMPELDVSQKEQIIDIVTVRRMSESELQELRQDSSSIYAEPIPDVYWEVFETFNDYNLISFKSYSESFNGFSLMEFYGHFVNYCKSNQRDEDDVNLYAIVNHYPRLILNSIKDTELLTVVKENEIYDVCAMDMRPIRFIICRETDNPILAMFSGIVEKSLKSYERVLEETRLLDDVSGVFREFFGEALIEMYQSQARAEFEREFAPRQMPILPEMSRELWTVVMRRILEREVEVKLCEARIEILFIVIMLSITVNH